MLTGAENRVKIGSIFGVIFDTLFDRFWPFWAILSGNKGSPRLGPLKKGVQKGNHFWSKKGSKMTPPRGSQTGPGMARAGQNGSEGSQIYVYGYMNRRGSERLWAIVAKVAIWPLWPKGVRDRSRIYGGYDAFWTPFDRSGPDLDRPGQVWDPWIQGLGTPGRGPGRGPGTPFLRGPGAKSPTSL